MAVVPDFQPGAPAANGHGQERRAESALERICDSIVHQHGIVAGRVCVFRAHVSSVPAAARHRLVCSQSRPLVSCVHHFVSCPAASSRGCPSFKTSDAVVEHRFDSKRQCHSLVHLEIGLVHPEARPVDRTSGASSGSRTQAHKRRFARLWRIRAIRMAGVLSVRLVDVGCARRYPVRSDELVRLDSPN